MLNIFPKLGEEKFRSLFVFSISDPKQNARSLLTPFSHFPLSHGGLSFALHAMVGFSTIFFIGQLFRIFEISGYSRSVFLTLILSTVEHLVLILLEFLEFLVEFFQNLLEFLSKIA